MLEEVAAVDPLTGEPLPNDDDGQATEGRSNSNTHDGNDKATGLDKALKDTQKAYHESRQEIAGLREKLAKLEGRTEEISKNKQPEQIEGYYSFLDKDAEESEIGTLFEDAKNTDRHIKKVVKKSLAGLPDMFDGLTNEILRKVEERINSAVAPDAPEIRQAIEELKRDEDLKGLDEKTLHILAKKRVGAMSKRQGTTYRGSPGASQHQRSVQSTDYDKAVEQLQRRFFPDYVGDKK